MVNIFNKITVNNVNTINSNVRARILITQIITFSKYRLQIQKHIHTCILLIITLICGF